MIPARLTENRMNAICTEPPNITDLSSHYLHLRHNFDYIYSFIIMRKNIKKPIWRNWSFFRHTWSNRKIWNISACYRFKTVQAKQSPPAIDSKRHRRSRPLPATDSRRYGRGQPLARYRFKTVRAGPTSCPLQIQNSTGGADPVFYIIVQVAIVFSADGKDA